MTKWYLFAHAHTAQHTQLKETILWWQKRAKQTNGRSFDSDLINVFNKRVYAPLNSFYEYVTHWRAEIFAPKLGILNLIRAASKLIYN